MAASFNATLLNRLLDATRECQTQYSTNGQIMTERNSNVSCVCRQFEEVLSHGLKRKQVPSSIYTIQSVTGLQLLDQQHPDPVFWHIVKSHLSKHELDRFSNLYHITSDVGRGRAWLRSALNEHSLERTFQMILGDVPTLEAYYTSDALLMDKEKSSLLPQIAGGLRSVMFSIKIDDPALNNSLQISSAKPERGANPILGNVISIPFLSAEVGMEEFPEASLMTSSSAPASGFKIQKKERKKAKKTKIIQFSHSGQQLPAEIFDRKEKSSSFSSPTKDFSHLVNSSATETVEAQDSIYRPSELSEYAGAASSKIEIPRAGPSFEYRDDSRDNDNSVKYGYSYDSHLSNASLQSNENGDNLRSDTAASIDLNEDEDSLGIGVSNTNFMLELRLDGGSEVSSIDDASGASIDLGAANIQNVDLRLGKLTTSDESRSSDEKSLSSPLESPFRSPSKLSSPQQNYAVEGDNDLRKALVVLLQRKDELGEECRALKDLLDAERARSGDLRAENERLKSQLEEYVQSNTIDNKRQLQENEVLRSQLKRYVGAVQALQHGKVSGEPILSDKTSEGSASQDAGAGVMDEKVYEQKLIDVTEMHGELMEFTESLHTRFLSALALIHKMHDELVALRGPLPTDNVIKAIEVDKQSLNLTSLPSLPKALINVWVPSAFLQGSGPESHHVYQIYTCLGDDEWNVYRRFSDFYVLHNSLCKPFPEVKKFGFPRKKNIGNRNSKIVEERRKAFQGYLRLVMHVLIQKNSRLAADPTKKTLVHILPFFSDSDSQCRVIVGKHK